MLITLLFYALGGAAKCSNSHNLCMYGFRIRSPFLFNQSINQAVNQSSHQAIILFTRIFHKKNLYLEES